MQYGLLAYTKLAVVEQARRSVDGFNPFSRFPERLRRNFEGLVLLLVGAFAYDLYAPFARRLIIVGHVEC